jgi:hypothetical protein
MCRGIPSVKASCRNFSVLKVANELTMEATGVISLHPLLLE